MPTKASWITSSNSSHNLFQIGDRINLIQQRTIPILKKIDPSGYEYTDQVEVRKNAINTHIIDIKAGKICVAGPLQKLDTNGSLVDLSTKVGIKITNVSRGSASQGSSAVAGECRDVLQSQIAMIDEQGHLIASFYRVASHPKYFTMAVATTTTGQTVAIGTGEFTNFSDLRCLIEASLHCQDATYVGSTTASVHLNEYGQLNIKGKGVAKRFRFVVNADQHQLRDRLEPLLYQGAADRTQAVIDGNGRILAYPSLSLGKREAHRTKPWFKTKGAENYGYNKHNKATEFGQFAGLRLSHENNVEQFGSVKLSLENALGNKMECSFECVAESSEAIKNQFSTLGELAKLVNMTLCSKDFSSCLSTDGKLQADPTAFCCIFDGHIAVSTALGSFRNLKLDAVSHFTNPEQGITRSDWTNFGTVLGPLRYGINGKVGESNQFLCPDVILPIVNLYDQIGNPFNMWAYFIQDQSSNLTKAEFKMKLALEPTVCTSNSMFSITDVDTDAVKDIAITTMSIPGAGIYQYTIDGGATWANFSTVTANSAESYLDSFNSVVDAPQSTDVLSFDLKTHKLSSSNRSKKATLRFTSLGEEQKIEIDVSKLTSYATERSTVTGQTVDGYSRGTLERLQEEDDTLYGIYSNGQRRALAKPAYVSKAR